MSTQLIRGKSTVGSQKLPVLEVKELKRRVRDVVEPGRDLGHVDKKKTATNTSDSGNSYEQSKAGDGKGPAQESQRKPDGSTCEDCG